MVLLFRTTTGAFRHQVCLAFSGWQLAALLMCCLAWPLSQASEKCPVPAEFAASSGAHLHPDQYANLGALFEKRKQFDCAADSFTHAVALNPSSARLQYSLGTSLYAAGRMAESESALMHAIELDPALTNAYLALGVVDHDLGKRKEALLLWQDALRRDPGSVTAMDWIAKARMESGQYTAAAELLRNAPDDEELDLDLIVAESKAGMFDEAIAHGTNNLRLHPDWLRLYTAVATVYVQRNRFEEASNLLKTAITTNRGNAPLEMLYLRVLVLKGDAGEASPLAKEILSKQPDDFDALYLNGLLEREQGDYESATKHLRSAIPLNPTNYDVRYNLGFALAKLKKPDEAKIELTKAISLDPSAPEAHYQMAAVLRLLGDLESAEKELVTYRDLMKEKEKRDEMIALTNEAGQQLDAGDTATAISIYKKVIERDPNDAVSYYRLAMALDRSNALEPERDALLHAIRLKPDFAAALNQMGYVMARSGKNAQAEIYFQEAIRSESQFAEAENNLGSLLSSENREKEAEQHLRAAIAANPRFTDAWINLAATYASISQFDAAREAAANALQMDPTNADAAQLLRRLPSHKQ